MNCRKCSGRVLVESNGAGGTILTCQSCGHHEVRNASGQRLLTDDQPSSAPARPRQLVEG